MLDVIGAILHREFTPLADAPNELQRIVTKALQKDRNARYQTAQDFAHDLQAWKDELAYQARAARASGDTERLGAHAARVLAAEANSSTEADTLLTKASALEALAREPRALPGLRASLIVVAALLVVAVAAYFIFARKTAPAVTEREPLLLADFENKAGEEIWDGTLKQALAVALEQSPYMNIFPEERARDTLRLMNRSVDESVTRATGREICQRRNVRAMLVGTIAKLERSYTVTLEATNAQRPLWPLAHLGLARAWVLQGEVAKAKQMYDEFSDCGKRRMRICRC